MRERLPVAWTIVVARLDVQGSFGTPGRHSQTVEPAASRTREPPPAEELAPAPTIASTAQTTEAKRVEMRVNLPTRTVTEGVRSKHGAGRRADADRDRTAAPRRRRVCLRSG